MRRTLLAVFSLLALFAPSTSAQVIRYGVIADEVRSALEHAWAADSGATGRAYCVSRLRISGERVSPTAVDTVYRVLAIREAPTDSAGVALSCPRGTPQLRTRPQASCRLTSGRWCGPQGAVEHSCQPSREELTALEDRGDLFGVVQCDRYAFRFFYASELLDEPDSATTHPANSPS